MILSYFIFIQFFPRISFSCDFECKRISYENGFYFVGQNIYYSVRFCFLRESGENIYNFDANCLLLC